MEKQIVYVVVQHQFWADWKRASADVKLVSVYNSKENAYKVAFKNNARNPFDTFSDELREEVKKIKRRKITWEQKYNLLGSDIRKLFDRPEAPMYCPTHDFAYVYEQTIQ